MNTNTPKISDLLPVPSRFHSPCFEPPVNNLFQERYYCLMKIGHFRFTGGKDEDLYSHIEKVYPKYEQNEMKELIQVSSDETSICEYLKKKFSLPNEKVDECKIKVAETFEKFKKESDL